MRDRLSQVVDEVGSVRLGKVYGEVLGGGKDGWDPAKVK
jgi:hypothetical protein